MNYHYSYCRSEEMMNWVRGFLKHVLFIEGITRHPLGSWLWQTAFKSHGPFWPPESSYCEPNFVAEYKITILLNYLIKWCIIPTGGIIISSIIVNYCTIAYLQQLILFACSYLNNKQKLFDGCWKKMDAQIARIGHNWTKLLKVHFVRGGN